MTTKTDKSRVASMALRIYQAHPTLQWSECMKRAWDFHWFRKMLANGIVHFRYWKVNKRHFFIQSEEPLILREARGTLLMDVIPEDKRPKGTSTYKRDYKYIAYYDLDKEGWRSFDVAKFICIERFIPKMRK